MPKGPRGEAPWRRDRRGYHGRQDRHGRGRGQRHGGGQGAPKRGGRGTGAQTHG